MIKNIRKKSKEKAYSYHSISAQLLDIARLLGNFPVLQLHYVAFDDVLGNDLTAKSVTHQSRLKIGHA